MLNKFRLAGLGLFLSVASQSFLQSQTIISHESSAFSGADYKFSLSQWMTRGDFRMYGGPPKADNTWELIHPLDGGITKIELSYVEKKKSDYTINISINAGNIRRGVIRDTDWDSLGVVSDLSYSTSNGNTFGLSFSSDYLITDYSEPYAFFISVGYNYQNISVDYRNPVIKIDSYVPTDSAYTIKWQVYDLVSQALEFGVKGRSGIGVDLDMSASLGYAPFAMLEYKGTRYPGTGFDQKEHIVAYGGALSYELKFSYKLSRQLLFDVGYRYYACRTEGKDQAGSAWAGSREKLQTSFKGLFFGGSLQF